MSEGLYAPFLFMNPSIIQQFILANASFILSLGLWRFTHWLIPVSPTFYAVLFISIFMATFALWLYWDGFRDATGHGLRLRMILANSFRKDGNHGTYRR